MADLRKKQGAYPADYTPSLTQEQSQDICEMLSPRFIGDEQTALLRAMDLTVDAAQAHIQETLSAPTGAELIGSSSGTVQDDINLLQESFRVLARVNPVSSVDGVVTLDYSLGDGFVLQLTEDVTDWQIINVPEPITGFSLLVLITQDTTPRSVDWSANTLWLGGGTRDVTQEPGAVDVVSFTSFDGGTTLLATINNNFY